VPVVRGRDFDERDARDAPPAVMVNEAMAERFWPGEDPVGRRLKTGSPDAPWAVVVGVVGDFKRTGLELAPRPQVFKPHPQMAFPLRAMRVVVWAEPGRAEALAPALRAAVWEVDPDQPISSLRPLEQVVADSLVRQRFTTRALGVFAAIALLLGAVGVYGVLSYTVSERTREVGVRMAVGAGRADILGWAFRRGLAPVALGIGVGVPAAIAAARGMGSLLYGVGAADPATLAGICLLLAAVAGVAVLVPARRATRVDPVDSLRS
jgi:predicted permease